MRHLLALLLLLAGLPTGGALAAEPGITRYTAEYEVETDGHHVANAEFRVAENADGYVFSSSARARGILRMVRPDPAVDWSEFSLAGERIVPSAFRYEDGSRKGEDNFSIVFDRAADEVRIDSAAGTKTLPLEAGLLDRGAVQVALMRDLSACIFPGPYRYVDDDGIGEYRFERVDDLAVKTGIGTLDTVRFSQQREGSSRETIFWLAPELAFLPVRIEQFRNGELRTSFMLDDVEGIERKPSACSGFR